MAKERIWTSAARQLLFQQLKEKFGPLSEWESTSAPIRGRAYDKFCDAFANIIGAKSGSAVKMQIRFGMPTRGEATWRDGYQQTAILCLAAAFDAGFITSDDLPVLHASGKPMASAKRASKKKTMSLDDLQ